MDKKYFIFTIIVMIMFCIVFLFFIYLFFKGYRKQPKQININNPIQIQIIDQQHQANKNIYILHILQHDYLMIDNKPIQHFSGCKYCQAVNRKRNRMNRPYNYRNGSYGIHYQ